MKRLVLIAFIVLVAIWWWRKSDRAPGPDAALAKHFQGICDIAAANVDRPVRGVDRLTGYFGDHGPDMLAQLGNTLVLIERIPDDRAHDARARQAARRMYAPLVRCQGDLIDFFDAVERDEEASARLERRMTRLGRTLEILLGGQGGALTEGAPASVRALLSR